MNWLGLRCACYRNIQRRRRSRRHDPKAGQFLESMNAGRQLSDHFEQLFEFRLRYHSFVYWNKNYALATREANTILLTTVLLHCPPALYIGARLGLAQAPSVNRIQTRPCK